jgi:hypothetical protein
MLFARYVLPSLLVVPFAVASTAYTPGPIFNGVTPVTVTYDANTPQGNFGAPGSTDDSVGYSIYLTSDSTNVYTLLVTDPAVNYTGLEFANLYFATDYPGGSTIGFESTNPDAFIPGVIGSNISLTGFPGYSAQTFDASNGYTNNAILVTIPWSFFTQDPLNMGFEKISYPANPVLRLDLSQSFSYSVAGGSTAYGLSELGVTSLTPEPGTMGLIGLAGLFLLTGGRKLRLATQRVK